MVNFFKSLTMPKKLKGDPSVFFNIHSAAKLKQKLKGALLVIFCQKWHYAEETERGTLESRPVLYVTREKGKTFLVHFLGPTSTNLKFRRTFGTTILVTSGLWKKFLEKF